MLTQINDAAMVNKFFKISNLKACGAKITPRRTKTSDWYTHVHSEDHRTWLFSCKIFRHLDSTFEKQNFYDCNLVNPTAKCWVIVTKLNPSCYLFCTEGGVTPLLHTCSAKNNTLVIQQNNRLCESAWMAWEYAMKLTFNKIVKWASI